MIGRLAVVAAGIVVGAAAIAYWNKRQAEEEAALRGAPLGDPLASSMRRSSPPPRVSVSTDEAMSAPDDDEEAAGDDLQALKGIGKVSEERLHEIGITTYAQIASWSPEELRRIAELIRLSPERIEREDWVGQARAAIA